MTALLRERRQWAPVKATALIRQNAPSTDIEIRKPDIDAPPSHASWSWRASSSWPRSSIAPIVCALRRARIMLDRGSAHPVTLHKVEYSSETDATFSSRVTSLLLAEHTQLPLLQKRFDSVISPHILWLRAASRLRPHSTALASHSVIMKPVELSSKKLRSRPSSANAPKLDPSHLFSSTCASHPRHALEATVHKLDSHSKSW